MCYEAHSGGLEKCITLLAVTFRIQYSIPFTCSPTLMLRFSKVSLASRLM